MKKGFLLVCMINTLALIANAQFNQKTIWAVGKADNLPNEFSLAPNGFKNFIEHDFGYEDKFFVIGYSKEKNDFPYVLPGPVDTWGGTWPTAGWRTNQVNLLFTVKDLPTKGRYKLVIKLADYAKKFLPMLKVSINEQDERLQLTAAGYDVNKQPHPKLNEKFIDTASLVGNLALATPKTIEILVKPGMIKKGGNSITITVVQGSWIMFDQVSLEGPLQTNLQQPGQLFVNNVKAADYELADNGKKAHQS
jgi:hypothetical protein